MIPSRVDVKDLLQLRDEDFAGIGPPVMVCHEGLSFCVRYDASCARTFEEVFQNGNYDVPFREYLGAEPKVIIDCGANVGVASAWFRSKFPDSAILAVEPSPLNTEVLRLNSDLLDLQVCEKAVARHAAQVELFETEWGTSTTTEPQVAERRRTPQRPDGRFRLAPRTVASTTIRALLDLIGGKCDILKIDIEGAEVHAIETIDSWANDVSFIAIEVHIADVDAMAIDRAIRSAGFRHVLRKGRVAFYNGPSRSE